jgi:hypothetical protein
MNGENNRRELRSYHAENSRGRVGDEAKQIRSDTLSELDQPKSPIHLIKIVSNSQPIAAHAVPRASQKTRVPKWYLVPSTLNLSMN